MTIVETDRAVIDGIRRRLEASENANDAAATGELLTDDAVLMVPDFPVQEGKAACIAFMDEVLDWVLERFDRRIAYASTEVAFADYRGNRQYVTQGNLAENPKAFIIAIDYLHRQRLKIWGRARVVEDDPALVAQLLSQGYRAKAEQAILFEVEAWCANCPSHIPQMLPAAEAAAVVADLQQRIQELEAENAALRGAGAPHPSGSG